LRTQVCEYNPAYQILQSVDRHSKSEYQNKVICV